MPIEYFDRRDIRNDKLPLPHYHQISRKDVEALGAIMLILLAVYLML